MSAAPLRYSKPAISTDIGATALYRATTQRLTRREASEITPSMTLLFRSTVFSRRLKIVGGESRHVSIVVSKRRSADATRPRRRPSKKPTTCHQARSW